VDKQKKPNEISDSEAKKPAEKPISLKPLKFEEAVKGLLKIKVRKTR